MGFSIEARKGKVAISTKFPWPLGIVLFMAYPSLQKSEEELEEAFDFLTRDGFFDRIEVHGISDEGWQRVRMFSRRVTLARGFQLDVLAGGRNISASDEVRRAAAVEYTKREIEREAGRGIREFAVCSGPVPQDMEEGKRQLSVSLREIAEHASEFRSNVFLETFDVDKDKKQLVGPIGTAVDIIEDVRENYPNLWLLWDQSHAPLLGERPDALRSCSKLLGLVHIGCGFMAEDGLKDWHPVYHTPGAINDETDLAQLLKVLAEIEYTGPVTAEVKPQQGQTPEEVVNSAKGAIYASYSMYAQTLG